MELGMEKESEKLSERWDGRGFGLFSVKSWFYAILNFFWKWNFRWKWTEIEGYIIVWIFFGMKELDKLRIYVI